MVTNFRCHPHILELAGSLFYTLSLKVPDVNDMRSWRQPYSSDSVCFRFVCSDIDERMQEVTETTNVQEAVVILENLMITTNRRNWLNEWGEYDVNKISIMSQSRRQVCFAYLTSFHTY